MFKNTASQKIAVIAYDSTTGQPKTGDAANISVYVSKDFGAVTQLTDTSATELDSTNAKGVYWFDVSQSESNADFLLFTGKSTTANVYVDPVSIYTTAPNSNLQSIDSNGRVDVIKVAGTTQTARDLGASVLISSGTGTGQLDVTSGVIKANLAQILGTALTETAGQIAAAFKQFFDVASPTGTMKAITAVTTVTNLTNAPTAGDLTATMKTSVENAVWDATAASHNTAGTTGSKLNSAASAGDPWDTSLPGAYASGKAGYILGTYLTAAPPTSTQNADALLNRDMSAVTVTNARSPINAFRFLRNKWSVSGGTLTVTKEDDTTTAWTATVSTDAAAVPVVGSDPA